MARVENIKQNDYKEELETFEKWFTECRNRRNGGESYREYRWIENNYFYDGRHYITTRDIADSGNRVFGTTSSNSGSPVKRSRRGVHRVVHKAARQLDSIRNSMLMGDPRFNLYAPVDKKLGVALYEKEDRADQLRGVQAWLEDVWKENKMRTKLHEIVHDAFKQNVAWVQLGIDQESGDPFIDHYNAFHFYVPFPDSDIEDQPYIIKETWRKKDEIRNNPIYKEAIDSGNINLESENAFSVSPAYRQYMRQRYSQESMQDIVLVHEYWIKKRASDDEYKDGNDDQVREGGDYSNLKNREPDFAASEESPFDRQEKEKENYRNEKDIERENRYNMRIVTIVNRKYVLRDETFNMDFYPIVPLVPLTGGMYKPALIERFISVNRTYDQVISRMEELIMKNAIGKWVVHENESHKPLTTDSAEIFTYRNVKPDAIQGPGYPNQLTQYLQYLDQEIQEQGISAVSMGNAPSGVRAGNALETLKASDEVRLGDIKTRIEEFIKEVTKKLIAIGDYYLDYIPYIMMEKDNPDEPRPVMGNERSKKISKDVLEEKNPIIIKKGIEPEVDIESSEAFTQTGRRQSALELYNAKAIDSQTLLEAYKFSNADEIVQNMMEEEGQRAKQQEVAKTNAQNITETEDFKNLPPDKKQRMLEELAGRKAEDVIAERQNKPALNNQQLQEKAQVQQAKQPSPEEENAQSLEEALRRLE